MLVRLAVTVVLLALATTGCERAEGGAGGGGVAATPSFTSLLPVQQAGMAQAELRTVEYAPGLDMDVYLPAGTTAGDDLPLVVLVHGIGPGSLKDFGGFVGWGRLLAANGMAAAVPNFRPSAGEDDEAAAELVAAVERVTSDATELGVDPDRVAVAAFSAGAPFGIDLALTLGDRSRGLVVFYGLLDGFPSAQVPDSYRLRTFLEQRPRVPTYVAVGAADDVPGVLESFERARRAAPPSATFVRHPRAGHAFDAYAPDDRTRRIIRGAVAVLEDALRG